METNKNVILKVLAKDIKNTRFLSSNENSLLAKAAKRHFNTESVGDTGLTIDLDDRYYIYEFLTKETFDELRIKAKKLNPNDVLYEVTLILAEPNF